MAAAELTERTQALTHSSMQSTVFVQSSVIVYLSFFLIKMLGTNLYE